MGPDEKKEERSGDLGAYVPSPDMTLVFKQQSPPLAGPTKTQNPKSKQTKRRISHQDTKLSQLSGVA